MNKQYYEADVIAEHLARRYSQGGLSGKVTEIGMQSLADAYNTYTEIDRRSDISRLIDLAQYASETWPDREEGDSARMNLGLIYSGMGQYDKAIEALAGVRTRSPITGSTPRTEWGHALGEEPRPGAAGQCHGGSGRGPEGARVLERLLEIPPRLRGRT